MANKLTSKNRQALLQGMRDLKAGGESISLKTQTRCVIDQRTARSQSVSKKKKWLYKPADLVRCKHYDWGEFNATVIAVNGNYVQLLGPMGSVFVSCQTLRLIDRFDETCDDSST